MSVDETITFSLAVKNTGNREGQEIVQLYIRDIKSSLPRPVKELKRFKKVNLMPGEEKIVSLSIDKEALSFGLNSFLYLILSFATFVVHFIRFFYYQSEPLSLLISSL